MLIEIHMLKNFAPTNLNRDDSGSPKTCIFGGVQRGRISSQCLKRSWRTSALFRDAIGENNLGIRTRKMPELVAESLRKDGIDEEIINVVTKTMTRIGKKDDKKQKTGIGEKDDNEQKTGIGKKDGNEQKENKTSQVIFYSQDDIEAVIQWVKNYIDKCGGNINKIKKMSAKDLEEELKKDSKRSITLDMALFGRMVTSDAFADVEASMQVAHAISTNRIMMESDFYIAIDDMLLSDEGESGSAMMGDVDYNSSCYYIYAAIDTDKLSENLSLAENKNIIVNVVRAIIETMAYSNPSGKQNSFAGHSLPSAVLIESKDKKIPVSYANAFEVPIRPTNGGLVDNSISALLKECVNVQKKFGIPVNQRLWFSVKDDLLLDEAIGKNCESFPDMLAALNLGGE